MTWHLSSTAQSILSRLRSEGVKVDLRTSTFNRARPKYVRTGLVRELAAIEKAAWEAMLAMSDAGKCERVRREDWPTVDQAIDAALAEVEVWKAVPGYEGLYEASNLGRVRSFYRDRRILSTRGTDETGYPVVSLNKEGRRRTYTLHRIICRTFHGEPRPLHREVAHLDGDKDNARADNLKWVSKVENESHKRLHGTLLQGEACPWARHTEDQVRRLKRLLAKGVGVTKGARITGISYSMARNIADGRRWRHVQAEADGETPNV